MVLRFSPELLNFTFCSHPILPPENLQPTKYWKLPQTPQPQMILQKQHGLDLLRPDANLMLLTKVSTSLSPSFGPVLQTALKLPPPLASKGPVKYGQQTKHTPPPPGLWPAFQSFGAWQQHPMSVEQQLQRRHTSPLLLTKDMNVKFKGNYFLSSKEASYFSITVKGNKCLSIVPINTQKLILASKAPSVLQIPVKIKELKKGGGTWDGGWDLIKWFTS